MSSIHYNLEIEEPDDLEEFDEPNELDTNWIHEYEQTEKPYNRFYLEDITQIKIMTIYVDNNNEIENIKEEELPLREPNKISREEIIQILKRNCIKSDKKYNIMTLLKYNIELEPVEVRSYILNRENSKYKEYDEDPYLYVIKDVDEIHLNRSISMFQDLNTIIIIFYENLKIKDKNYQDSKMQSKTKKIYLSLQNHKKTLRKTI